MSVPFTVATAVVGVTAPRFRSPDDSASRKPPMNATARIQKTNFAELRMTWSTSRTPSATGKNGREGKLKKLSGDSG
jgi:hypothetical protein